MHAPGLGDREFGIEHANRVLKIQGADPNGWKLKEGQQFELNEHGVIVRTSNQTNPEPSGEALSGPSRRARRKD